jgi:hypothetical protein
MCRDAGLDITFASDAHTPEMAHWEHAELRCIALAAGYTHSARFHARRRSLEPIEPGERSYGTLD